MIGHHCSLALWWLRPSPVVGNAAWRVLRTHDVVANVCHTVLSVDCQCGGCAACRRITAGADKAAFMVLAGAVPTGLLRCGALGWMLANVLRRMTLKIAASEIPEGLGAARYVSRGQRWAGRLFRFLYDKAGVLRWYCVAPVQDRVTAAVPPPESPELLFFLINIAIISGETSKAFLVEHQIVPGIDR